MRAAMGVAAVVAAPCESAVARASQLARGMELGTGGRQSRELGVTAASWYVRGTERWCDRACPPGPGQTRAGMVACGRVR